jgi:hypothetical protein
MFIIVIASEHGERGNPVISTYYIKDMDCFATARNDEILIQLHLSNPNQNPALMPHKPL